MIHLNPELARALEAFLESLEDEIREGAAQHFIAAKMDPDTGAVVVPGWTGTPESAAYQCAVARSGAALEQHGLFNADARRLATRAVDYIIRTLWDADHGGWYELPADEDANKQLSTQTAVLVALVEFLMVSGDFEAAEKAVETFKTIQVFAADNAAGGYHLQFSRDWQVIEPGTGGNPLLAEALGLAFVALGTEIYRRRAVEAIERLGAFPLPDPAALGPVLAIADLVCPDDGGSLKPLLAAIDVSATSPSANSADTVLDQRWTALEMWRLTRQTVWLERFALGLKSMEPAGGDSAFIPPGALTSNGALPRVLRIETLLVKALFGSK